MPAMMGIKETMFEDRETAIRFQKRMEVRYPQIVFKVKYDHSEGEDIIYFVLGEMPARKKGEKAIFYTTFSDHSIRAQVYSIEGKS